MRIAAAGIVGASWLIMTILGFVMIEKYGSRVPYLDDYAYVPLNFFGQNQTIQDFWIPINEHRVPAPKIATWATTKLFGRNLKHVMRVNHVMMAIAVLAMLHGVRRIRGLISITDAFIPIVVLSFGPADQIWAVWVNFAVPVAAVIIAIPLMIRCGARVEVMNLAGIFFLGLILSFSGIQGQLYSIAVVVWLGYVSVMKTETRSARIVALLAAFMIATATTVCVLHYERPANVESPSPFGVKPLIFTLKTLGSAWGPWLQESPVTAVSAGALTLAFVVMTFAILIREYRKASSNRLDVLGLFALIVVMSLLALAIGLSRGEMNQWRVADRYVTLMMPLLLVVYVTMVRCVRGNSFVCASLALIACGLAVPNFRHGLAVAHGRFENMQLIMQDVSRGVPASFAADHHSSFLFPPDPAYLKKTMQLLRDNGLAPFQQIAAEPDLQIVPLTWSVEWSPRGGSSHEIVAEVGEAVRGELRFERLPGQVGILFETSVQSQEPIRAKLTWNEENDGGITTRVLTNVLEVGHHPKRIWFGRPIDLLTIEIAEPQKGPITIDIVRIQAMVKKSP